jgi:hypothetical protein
MVRDRCIVVAARDKGILHMGPAATGLFQVLARVKRKRRPEMTKNEDLPKLTAEQRMLVDPLAEVDIKRLDQALLSNASTQWSRTDRIVLATMIELDNGMGLPTRYFIERIGQLVKDGLLESKGDSTDTRSDEVRLKS